MSSGWMAQIEGYRGWKMRVAMILAAVALAGIIVAGMQWLLKGEVTYDYLVTGLVAAAVVAKARVTLTMLTRLLDELAISHGAGAPRFMHTSQIWPSRPLVLWDIDFVTQLENCDLTAHACPGWVCRRQPDQQIEALAGADSP